MEYCLFKSPIGQLMLIGEQKVLYKLHLQPTSPQTNWLHAPRSFIDQVTQLSEYFSGQRTVFNFAYKLIATKFQNDVLKEVEKISYGATASYADIAANIKNPKAVRAVGTANANNPLPIIIPCHRVIGKNGSLTGYAGGIETKKFLLELENAL